ncbi:MAG: ATP-binding protein [Acidobacteria bacterium]|nr:ATP-binding protein [Acidobacteriota bacterium]
MKAKAMQKGQSGKLRIGDDWNAITVIALSQQSPLKAVAELVENSIDAHASRIIITRGKEKGAHYLRITDNGDGIPKDGNGLPDFQYVATHICDSIKRRLKSEDREGVQGEFGIGLLSFWTLGEGMTMASAGTDGRTYEMRMGKGEPRYTLAERKRLFPEKGTEVLVYPLLPGIRNLSGEKIQWYLASELRDRMKRTGVTIQVIDRQARTSQTVVPREFSGRLLHRLPSVQSEFGEVYLELYLDDAGPENHTGLYRHGTRVVEDIATLDAFQHAPWTSGCLQGIIDAPFLNLTPGTRTGILHDGRFQALYRALEPAEAALVRMIEEQKRAAEEQASKDILRSIHRAFKEALLALPVEEYDWFEIQEGRHEAKPLRKESGAALQDQPAGTDVAAGTEADKPQREFFNYPGPLYRASISPTTCNVRVGKSRNFRAVARDRNGRLVEDDLIFEWAIMEGPGRLSETAAEIVSFQALQEPGLTRLRAVVRQGEIEREAEALITVTEELLPETAKMSGSRQGLPAYTFDHRPGELWRSRFDETRNLIIINNAHRDFVYAARGRMLKLRYICRLYVKELVYKNFPGLSADQLLERMVELSVYTEEHLK